MAVTVTVTVSDDEASMERQQPTKILTINDSSSSSSSSLIDLSATTFRDNIRSFLRDYAVTQDYTVDGNNTTVSRLFLASEATGVGFPLFVIEEQISDGSSSPNPLCDFCRCAGWGHHYVSKRRYHLIIPASDEWNMQLRKDSLEVTSSSPLHLMHGVIHCNGFGHLLCVNSDDASGYLSGDRVMDLWDRLCSALHTRKISLDDTSRKGSMDLRLLHGVAYGRPWFGKWDYMLSHGNFGIRKDQYTRAILILSTMELDKIMEDFSGKRKEKQVKKIIGFYRESSQTPLVTLSDLLQFMLVFRSKAPVERKTAMALAAMSLNHVSSDDDEDTSGSPICSSPDQEEESDDNGNESCTDTLMDKSPAKYESFDAMATGECSRWSGKRLSEVARAVLKVFKDRRNRVITRHELREAVRGSIGDTGLIDFLLKHIDKVLIGDQIVQRFTNPESRMLQFSLMTVNSPSLDQECTSITTPGLDPYEDVLYMYQKILLGYPDTDVYSDASEVILNCKSFVKEWPLPSYVQEHNKDVTVSCQVLPNHEELLRDLTRKLAPGELVMVSQNATIKELKFAVEKALRDTYRIMESYEVLEIRNKNLEKIDENSGLKSEGGKIEKEFVVTGFGLDIWTELRYEGGFDDWTVDCKCGATDDDGERMVACDTCKVWHHTKCHYIEDDEDVPSVFLCYKCFGGCLSPKKRSTAIR